MTQSSLHEVISAVRGWVDVESPGTVVVSHGETLPDDAAWGLRLEFVGLSRTARHTPPEPGRILHEVEARVLISIETGGGGAPIEALEAIARLATSDPPDPRMTIEPSLDPETWLALQRPMGAALLIRALVHRAVEVERPPLVRRHDVRAGPVVSFDGCVVGPEGVRLPGALVEIESLGLRASTDEDGRFRFGAVPLASEPPPVTVTARGHRVELIQPRRDDASGRWIVELAGLES